jgi:putative hemolysin
MQKRLDRPEDPTCSTVDYPAPGLTLQKTIRTRNIFSSPSSICELVHKINCLHKPPRLVYLSRKEKKEKMKKIFTFTIILLALTACTSLRIQTPEPAATEIPQANIPNPASVYCEQNGNTLEIRTAADGSQSGVCIFPDGSTCDEWAYFRGECGPATQTSPTPAMTSEATVDASGGGPGGIGGAEGDGSGGYMPPGTTEEIADWRGVIKSTEPGAQYDDYFELWTNGQIIYFGIDSMDPAVQAQIVALRNSGKIVHLYGSLFSNVPDYNGSQVQVDRIVVEG